MAKLTSIKTIEADLKKQLDDVMYFIDVRGDTIELRSKDEKNPISFSIMDGDQITPRYREVNIKLNFESFEDPIYLKAYSMIPLKRTRLIFQRGSVADIKNVNCLLGVPNQVNYMYGVSFSRIEKEKDDASEVISKVADIIRYNYGFVKLHNELFKKGNRLNSYWNVHTNKSKADVEPALYKDDLVSIMSIPMMKKNDLVFIVADYKTPEGLVLPQKNEMFPHKRLNSLVPKIFPTPRIYSRGLVVDSVPSSISDSFPYKDLNVARRVYQMEFTSENSNKLRVDKVLELVRDDYIPSFIRLHYETLDRSGIKNSSSSL